MMEKTQLNVCMFGKHPSSSEYLYFGESSEFMNSVSKWIQRGYEAMLQSKVSIHPEKIHHFLFLNEQKDSFITGSMKLSQDKFGRKFPFVIAVEIIPYTFFANFDECSEYAKELNEMILDIFAKEYSFEELKTEIFKLSRHNPVQQEKKNIFALFRDEKFNNSKLFFRPLNVDDFITMMR